MTTQKDPTVTLCGTESDRLPVACGRAVWMLVEMCREHGTVGGNGFKAVEFPSRRDAYALGRFVKDSPAGTRFLNWDLGEPVSAHISYADGWFQVTRVG